MSIAQQVAELIHAEAGSGSASWDELNGPSAVLSEVTATAETPDGQEIEKTWYTIILPAEYDDNGPVWNRVCVIKVEERDQ